MRRCGSGRSSSTASSRRAPSRERRGAARGAARAGRPRSPLARGAAPGRHLARDRAGRAARAPLGAARHGRHLRARAISSRRSSCAPCPAQVAGVRRIVVCTPPQGAGLVAAAAEVLGLDEVWALGGPQAIGWLAYVERVDKIVGPGNQYVNDAKLEVSRDVPIDLPGGPSEVVVLGRRRPAADRARARGPARARPRRGVPQRGDARRRRRRSRPSTSCCSATPRPTPDVVRNAGSVFVGPWSPVAAGDYATGGNHVLPTNGWARSVGGLGLETFLKPVTVQRLDRGRAGAAAADDRGARRGRGHARARRGGAPMRAVAPEFRPYAWALPTDEVARLAGIDPSQVLRFDQNTPPLPLVVDAARDGRRRARARQRLPGRRLPRAAPGDRRLRRRRAGERRARRRGRRPDPALRARLRRPGRHDRHPRVRRRTRSFASRPSSRAPRSATTIRCSPSPAGRTTRPASSGRCRTRDRSSSTRRTSSTAA